MWFARIVEFAFVGCLLLVVKTPQTTRHGGSNQQSDIHRGNSYEETSIKLSKWNSKEEETIDMNTAESAAVEVQEESTTEDVHTTDEP